MHVNNVLPHGAAYAEQLRKEADIARLRAEVYTTEADLANLGRRFAGNALRAFARRIARLAERLEPAPVDATNRRRACPTRTTA